MLIALVTTVRLGCGDGSIEVGPRAERGRDRGGRGAAAEADDGSARHECARRLGDPLLLRGVLVALVADRQLVGDRLPDRAAARAGEQLLLGQGVQVAPGGRRRDVELATMSSTSTCPVSASRSSIALSRSARFMRVPPVRCSGRRPLQGEQAEQARRLAGTASRPAPRYLRESTSVWILGQVARIARVKNPFRWVETLILVMPGAMAAAIVSSGHAAGSVQHQRHGRGAACSRAMRSRSSAAVRSVIACEEPTATASASTPVSATNARASAGSVRTPGACAPSLPPISPSSPSTKTSSACACSTTRTRRRDVVVVVELAAVEHDRAEAQGDRLPASSPSSAWSRCTATCGRHARASGEGGQRDRLEAAVVVGAVLRDLQDDRAGPPARRRRREPRRSPGGSR